MNKPLAMIAAVAALALVSGCETPGADAAGTAVAGAQATANQAMQAAQRAQNTAEEALRAAQAAQASADRAFAASEQTRDEIRLLNEKVDRMFATGLRK